MTATADNNRAVVVKFVSAIGDGRLDDARSLLHHEFVTHAAAGVPYSGDYHGPDGSFELLTQIYDVLEPTPSPDMQYLAYEDKIVIYYRLTFTARRIRRECRESTAEVFTVHATLIVVPDVVYKDPAQRCQISSAAA